MRIFVTELVESIKAREIVEQLVIDGVRVLDAFEKEDLRGTTYITELRSILIYIEHFANGNSIGSRVKYLKGGIDTEYEFITKHLRIYAIQDPNKKIIIYCGIKKKADSSDNIKSFRLIKNAYLEFIKSKK